MNGSRRSRRNTARARKDATAAVDALTDAASIVGVGIADRAGTGVHDARAALARAIDPTPAPVRRLPWLLAVVGLTALSAWGWRLALRARTRPVDPGTPVSTVAPSEDELFGKPVGNSPTRTEA